MFTGLYPSEHGATRPGDTLSTNHETVAEELAEAGFDTGLFTPNMFLTEFFGMDQGFGEVNYVEQAENKLFNDAFDPIGYVRRRNGEGVEVETSLWRELIDGSITKNVANAFYYKLSSIRDSEAQEKWDEVAVESAVEFIEDRSESDRFFAIINLIEAHAPWSYDRDVLTANGVEPSEIAPESQWRMIAKQSGNQWEFAAGELSFSDTDQNILKALYEAWIRRTDTLLSDLLTHLERCGVRDETLVIVTADHGERLGTDGVLGHTYSLHEEVTHIPLVCAGPTVPSGVVEKPVSLKDLYGTILRSTDVNDSVETLLEPEPQGTAFTEMEGANPDRIAELRGERYRSIAERYGRRSALYTTEGRAEHRHKSGSTDGDPKAVERLEAFLESLERSVDKETGSEAVPDEIGDRLEHLGYR
jgi:arylsulfatase A-like enzyme